MKRSFSVGDRVLVNDKYLIKQTKTNPVLGTVSLREGTNYIVITDTGHYGWWVDEAQLKPAVYSDGLDNWE